VDMLRNIETLRRRPISYLSWSGVDNLLAAPTGSTDPAPALYLGLGDINTVQVPVHIPQEVVEQGSYTIHLHAYLVDVVGSIEFDFMGNRVSFTGNGWQTAEIEMQIEADAELSRLFDLNIYRIGPENTFSNNFALISQSTVPWTAAKIQSLSIWGV